MKTSPELLRLWIRWGKVCAYCGKQVKLASKTRLNRATKDHYIPKILGGKDAAGNYVLACSPCNSDKGDKHPDLYLPAEQRGWIEGRLVWASEGAK